MEQLDLKHCYDVALDLTKQAGQLIATAIKEKKNISIKTGNDDVVTETDHNVENLLINGLKKHFPNHKFIAEESAYCKSYEANTDLPTWIIDPLDGTMNFVHGYPQVCVSVALWHKNEPQVGFVYNPVLQQLFSCRRGFGVFLNDQTIHVSNKTKLIDSIIGGDIMAYIGEEGKLENTILNCKAVKSKCQAIRIPGSVAITLAYVAMGALDGYYECSPRSWDYAAGVALVLEAGGVVTAMNGGEFDLFARNIVAAATPELAKELSSTVKPFLFPREGSENK